MTAAANTNQHVALPQPVVQIPIFEQPNVLLESASGASPADATVPDASSDDDTSDDTSGSTIIMSDSDDDVALSFGRGDDPREFLQTVPIIQRALATNKDGSASGVKLVAKAISVCKPKEPKVLLNWKARLTPAQLLAMETVQVPDRYPANAGALATAQQENCRARDMGSILSCIPANLSTRLDLSAGPRILDHEAACSARGIHTRV